MKKAPLNNRAFHIDTEEPTSFFAEAGVRCMMLRQLGAGTRHRQLGHL